MALQSVILMFGGGGGSSLNRAFVSVHRIGVHLQEIWGNAFDYS